MVAGFTRSSDGIGLRLDTVDSPDRTEDDINDILRPGGGRATRDEIAVEMRIQLQADHDIRIERATLPDDEETKDANPRQPHIFWDGGDIVSRNTVYAVEWNGAEYRATAEAV